MLPEGTGMKNGVDLAVAEAGGVAGGFCLEVRSTSTTPRRRPASGTARWRRRTPTRQWRSAGHRLHRHVQLRRSEGLHSHHQPRPHGPGDARQHLPRPHQEARRRARRAGDLPGRRLRELLRPVPADDIQGAVPPSGRSASARRRCSSSTTRSSTARASPTSSRPPRRRSGWPWSPTRASTETAGPEAHPHQDPRVRRRPRLHGRCHRDGRPGGDPADEGGRAHRAAHPLPWGRTVSSRKSC